jgi:enamine deaminase RidA (YjgF/YER057c/UK114 family)
MSVSAAAVGAGESHAPAVRVTGPSGLHFLSGINPNPVYTSQPLTKEDELLPSGIADQTRLTLEHLDEVLSAGGLDWTSVAKVILYLTDMREAPAVRAGIVDRYGDAWWPAFTTVQVDNLVARGARMQLDVIAAGR